MNQLFFVILMLVAIGLHEFGHFATAKMFGIKVEKFFIGFGPKIWSVRRGETEYGFNWIPAGGYVRIAGMNPFEEISPEDRARTFKAKKPWQRAIVLVAGSTMHFIIAFVVLAGLLMTAGVKDGPATTTVEVVSPGTPAAASGLKPGDRVLAVDDRTAVDWKEVREYIRTNAGRQITFLVLRDGAEIRVSATPAVTNPEGEKVGFLGVSPFVETIKRSPPIAVWHSLEFIGTASWESLKALKKIVSISTMKHLFQVVSGKEQRTIEDPASVVGITRFAGSVGFTGLMYLFVGFNIFVGVANLLPLPPLDGGHLAVLAYEKLTGRDVDMRKLIPVTAVVIAVFVGLFLISLYLDIVNPLPPLPG